MALRVISVTWFYEAMLILLVLYLLEKLAPTGTGNRCFPLLPSAAR